VLADGTARSGEVVACLAVGDDLDWHAERRGIDHLAVADVESDVMDLGRGIAPEQEVTRLQGLSGSETSGGEELGVSSAGQVEPCGGVRGFGQARAVERVGPGPSPLVGLSQLGVGVMDGDVPARRRLVAGSWCRRGRGRR